MAVSPLQTAKFNSRNFALDSGGFKTSTWHHQLVEGETIDDCLEPSNYARVMAANQTPKRKDKVEVFTFDNEGYAEFRVVASDKTYLKLRKIREVTGEAVVVPESSPLEPRWNVGKLCYEVQRKSDKAVLRTDFKTKADAVEWMESHITAMKAA